MRNETLDYIPDPSLFDALRGVKGGGKWSGLDKGGKTSSSSSSTTTVEPEVTTANDTEISADEATNTTATNTESENNYNTPVDYSWIAQVDVDDDLLNEKIKKSNVESTDISREYDNAWNYADPFNPFREHETLQEQLKNDFDRDAYEQNALEHFIEESKKLQSLPKVERTKDRRDDAISPLGPATGAPRGKLEEIAKNSPKYAKAGVSTELNNPAKESPMYANSDLDKIFEANSEKMGQKTQEWTKEQFTDEEWEERQKEHAEKEKWDNYRSDFLDRLDNLTRTKDPDEEGPAEYDFDRLHRVEDDWEPLKEEMKAHPDFEKEVYENYWNSLEKGIYDGYSKLEEAAKNSPMLAQAGISTELNNPKHEETVSEAMKNEAIPFATSKELKSGWKDTSKPGNTKEELEAAQKELNESKELFTPEQKRAIADFDPNKGTIIMDVANALTLGLAPKVNKVPNFDKVAYSSLVEKRAKEYGDASKAISEVNKLIERSQFGLAKEGVEYWRETGDTLGNKYAEQAENTVAGALLEYQDGKITDAELGATLDAVVNPSSSEQLKSLFASPALKGLEIYGLGAGAGAAIGKGLSVVASKITPKVIDKLVETAMSNSKAASAAEKVLKMLSSNPKVRAELSNARKLDIFEKAMKNDFSGDFYKSGIGKYLADNYGETLASQINNASKIASGGDDILRVKDVKVITDAIQKGIITGEDLVKAIAAANNVSEDTAKKVAAASGIAVGVVKGAEAAPTGIFNEKGKMVDSKEIVAERKDKPYEGEDAVTIYSREGKVTVSPKEAVIIGEAENLPPSRGYTDEVRNTAKGSEVYEQPEVQKVQPTDEQIGFWQKAGDIVQAILGGRDLNNDKTITKSEWYESTIGKISNKFKNAFSGSDAIDKVGKKSVWQKIKNKFSSALDSVGKSIPGVVDLKNGTAYINSALDKPNLDLSPEAIRGTIETAVVDSLPNWSDKAGQELKKNIASTTVSEALAANVFGNFGVITAAKIVGQYVTDTVSEIAHLYGKDLDNDEKGAINFIVTNAVGLPLAPVSTIVRDAGTSFYGVATRNDIEDIFKNGSNVSSEFYIIPYKSGAYPQKSSYGTSSGGSASAEGKYSGYREQAKDSNLAKDYNEGLEQNINEAVSDMKVKIFSVYNNEPDYIRNAIGKILKSFKENY